MVNKPLLRPAISGGGHMTRHRNASQSHDENAKLLSRAMRPPTASWATGSQYDKPLQRHPDRGFLG